jgi:transcriptional regulator with GAF, ATPase, and Fis domain
MTVLAWIRELAGTDTPLVRTLRAAFGDQVREIVDAPVGIIILEGLQPSHLQQIRVLSARVRILVLSGPDLQLSADAKWSILAAGASDVLDWPAPDRLATEILPRISRWNEVDALVAGEPVRSRVVGESLAWRNMLRNVVEIAAFSDSGLLLSGETGTGKEQIARLVHALDRRPRKADLVIVDCTTLSRELMGSELFGHERGAFTGAIAGHDGAIALSHRGTLFLDEIGELELPLQAQLLRVIQERTFKRIGSNVWQQADFRLICATNRDLEREVREGRFRADLYYRISDRIVCLPPLRDRREDILSLVEHFWPSTGLPRNLPELDPALRDFLMNREYPGNVRDLRRIVMALSSRHAGGNIVSIGAVPESERSSRAIAISVGTVPRSVSPPDRWDGDGFSDAIKMAITSRIGLKDISRAASAAAIRVALEQEDGNLQRAARRLGVTDRALQMRRANGEALSP